MTNFILRSLNVDREPMENILRMMANISDTVFGTSYRLPERKSYLRYLDKIE